MRNLIRRELLLVGVCLIAGAAAWGTARGQDANAPKAKPDAPPFDVAVTYDAMLSNSTTGAHFWMQGGSAQAHYRFWRGVGAVADLTGEHTGNINNSGVGLSLVTLTFGPRYTWSPAPHSRYEFFGLGLIGAGFGFNSTLPSTSSTVSSAASLATQLGGGIDVSASHRFAFRAIEASWVRSQIPNATDAVQNSMKLGAGVVCRLP